MIVSFIDEIATDISRRAMIGALALHVRSWHFSETAVGTDEVRCWGEERTSDGRAAMSVNDPDRTSFVAGLRTIASSRCASQSRRVGAC